MSDLSLYVGYGRWVNPKLLNTEDKAKIESSWVQIIAFNPNKPVLQIPEVDRQLNLLSVPGGILYDRLSKSEYDRKDSKITFESFEFEITLDELYDRVELN